MKRLPSYLAGWFLALTTISVFIPVTLAMSAKTLGVVLLLFLMFNYKHLTRTIK